MVYYNEFDPKNVAWLRELISDGLIAKGEVDERDIRKVSASDLRGFDQHHFFAGVGGWSVALRLAGWNDTRPVWTASLPCQPWSIAGEGEGAADDRNLWPAYFRLVQKLKPEHQFGEQVEAAIKLGWLDGISTDLEQEGYTVRAVVLPAACVGAPHPRHRIFWMAYAGYERERRPENGSHRLEHASRAGREERHSAALAVRPELRSIANSGAWSDWRIIGFTDGKTRRIESGIEPVVDGISPQLVRVCDSSIPFYPAEARQMRLRGYGNAIVPQVAAEFIASVCEELDQ